MGAFKKIKYENLDIKCVCGSFIKYKSMKRHERTKKHIEYIKLLDENNDCTDDEYERSYCCVVCNKPLEYDKVFCNNCAPNDMRE